MPTLTMNPLTHFHHWSYVTNKDGARKGKHMFAIRLRSNSLLLNLCFPPAIDIIKAEKIRETTKQWIKM